MLLVLAMLMTMFAGLGVASAADMYAVSSVPTIDKGEKVKLGTIVVTAYNLEEGVEEGFIVKLPEDFVITRIGTVDVVSGVYGIDGISKLADITVTKPESANFKAEVYGTAQKNRVRVAVTPDTNVEELKFNLGLSVTAPAGLPSEIYANIAKQPASLFSDGAVLVARSGAGAVEVIANDPVSFGSKAENVTISVRVNTNDAFDSLSFKLPAGFTWDAKPMLRKGDSTVTSLELKDSERTAKFESTEANPVGMGIWTLMGKVAVDESRAKYGDVVVSLSGSNVKPSSITIGTYADYGVEVEASEAPTVLAGLTEVETADIIIKETAAGSLVDGRSVYLTLPNGVRWVYGDNEKLELDKIDNTGSANVDGDITVYTNKKEMAKLVIKNVKNEGTAKKGSITIKKPQIEIAPDFVGDIKVQVTGSAGVEGEVKIAEVIAPVTVKADVTDVKIGLQAQAGGNIVITEAKAEALNATATETDKDGKDYYVDAFLTLRAPQNVQWAKLPTVKVVEGDLEIGTVTRVDNNRELSIRIKESSTEASKIEISDVAWTVDRTVPEGDMKVNVAGNSLVQVDFTNRTNVVSFVAANVVTPAPGETVGSGEFRIGSNIYYVGGTAKVMDVAPYIKDSRTYVPMRYLGEILGAEVVWDDAARTVTLTRGDDVVVFTIGSESYTVNGEALAADVAPEIVNDRTMLPARFVAEAFGAVVGWDATTQTVLIQK